MINNDDSILAMYLKDIKNIPLLTREEEKVLAEKAKTGDKAARDKILKANLRFVIKVAKNYQNHGLDLIDLISEGNIGLINAIEKFDVSKGYHFISYAVWWINQSILKAISEKSRAIRLPLNKANELVRIEQAKKIVAGNKSEQQEFEEIGSLLGMDASYVREMVNISRDMVSLDADINNSESEHTSVADFCEDEMYAKPEEIAVENAMKEDIDGVLKTLRPNEEKVIRMRYGLNGLEPMSLQEVGKECELTKERIRQIEKHALVRLQHPTRRRLLESYVA